MPEVLVTITTDEAAVLQGVLVRENARIAFENAQPGAPQRTPLAFESLVQKRLKERIEGDMRAHINTLVADWGTIFLNASPQQRAAIVAAIEAARTPEVP
jgi:hypothetical protein